VSRILGQEKAHIEFDSFFNATKKIPKRCLLFVGGDEENAAYLLCKSALLDDRKPKAFSTRLRTLLGINCHWQFIFSSQAHIEFDSYLFNATKKDTKRCLLFVGGDEENRTPVQRHATALSTSVACV